MSSVTGASPDFITTPASSASPGLWLPSLSLAKRELVRFLRQPHRVIGAFATPIVFWLLVGLGMGRSFRGETGLPGGENYLEFFFPGTVLMILLFTSIFSTISSHSPRCQVAGSVCTSCSAVDNTGSSVTTPMGTTAASAVAAIGARKTKRRAPLG